MSTTTDTIEREKTELKRPGRWAVVLHNDNVTPMDFVVELLYSIFNMDLKKATELMLKIHNEGQGVAGVYPYEIAEQKYAETQTVLQLSGYHLKITLEEE